MDDAYAIKFIAESNHIEGIHRDPFGEEIDEFHRFMALDTVTVSDMEQFVKVYQPKASLRIQPGMNVRVGTYFPPPGGPRIRTRLDSILRRAQERPPKDAYFVHQAFEKGTPSLPAAQLRARCLAIRAMG